jgi:hypothetical protein
MDFIYIHTHPRCIRSGIYTSGKGSSAVGLTASVVRDPETRALVLESGEKAYIYIYIRISSEQYGVPMHLNI